MGFGLVLRLAVEGELVWPKNREPDIYINMLATENVLSAIIMMEYEYIFKFDIIIYLYFNNNHLDRL